MQLQIGYLRAMSDAARVRAACITYLQTWLPGFYPNRMDLVAEMQRQAEALGGHLRASRKYLGRYRWIQQTLGWSAAQRTQVNYDEWKDSLLRSWDKVMFQMESRMASRK